MRVALIFLGGGAGSALRYLVGMWIGNRLGVEYPWGTLTINVTGSFLIGVIATLADRTGAINADVRALLVVGVLGGYTTFSSFMLESWKLADTGDLVRAASYIGASVALGVVAVIAGVELGRAVA